MGCSFMDVRKKSTRNLVALLMDGAVGKLWPEVNLTELAVVLEELGGSGCTVPLYDGYPIDVKIQPFYEMPDLLREVAENGTPSEECIEQFGSTRLGYLVRLIATAGWLDPPSAWAAWFPVAARTVCLERTLWYRHRRARNTLDDRIVAPPATVFVVRRLDHFFEEIRPLAEAGMSPDIAQTWINGTE